MRTFVIISHLTLTLPDPLTDLDLGRRWHSGRKEFAGLGLAKGAWFFAGDSPGRDDTRLLLSPRHPVSTVQTGLSVWMYNFISCLPPDCKF